MGDSGEGLVDNESRLQERMEELKADREKARKTPIENPEEVRKIESLKLARTEMERQLNKATSEARRVQVANALAEIDRQIAQIQASIEKQ